jgi:hypothetical protein
VPFRSFFTNSAQREQNQRLINPRTFHTTALSDIWGKGRIWGVNSTGIVFNTEGNSADRKSQERNTMDFHIGTTREGEVYARREARWYESGGAATFLGTV